MVFVGLKVVFKVFVVKGIVKISVFDNYRVINVLMVFFIVKICLYLVGFMIL